MNRVSEPVLVLSGREERQKGDDVPSYRAKSNVLKVFLRKPTAISMTYGTVLFYFSQSLHVQMSVFSSFSSSGMAFVSNFHNSVRDGSTKTERLFYLHSLESAGGG